MCIYLYLKSAENSIVRVQSLQYYLQAIPIKSVQNTCCIKYKNVWCLNIISRCSARYKCTVSVSKPFAELSLVQRVNPHSNVKQFKYCKLLIQEFHIKVDTGFINALVKMFEGSAATDDEQVSISFLIPN